MQTRLESQYAVPGRGPDGWKGDTPLALSARILDEWHILHDAIAAQDGVPTPEQAQRLIDLAADVSNYGFFVADTIRVAAE